MARKYDIESLMGEDYEFELTPEVLAFEMSMDFANQVIQRCDEVGIELNELASRMGISASTLSEKLNGQNLTLKSIASMAVALSCDVKAPELVADASIRYCMHDRKWSFSEVPMGATQIVEYDVIDIPSVCSESGGTRVNNDASVKPAYQFGSLFRKAA